MEPNPEKYSLKEIILEEWLSRRPPLRPVSDGSPLFPYNPFMHQRQRVIRTLEWTIVGLFVVIVIGYSGFAAKRVFEGPQISIEAPSDGATMSTSLIVVQGTTKNALSLTLNGRLIPIDTTGRFQEQLLLSYGYNIIELVATDRTGEALTKTITLFYQ
jgi:hypothetical protein